MSNTLNSNALEYNICLKTNDSIRYCMPSASSGSPPAKRARGIFSGIAKMFSSPVGTQPVPSTQPVEDVEKGKIQLNTELPYTCLLSCCLMC